MEKGTGFFVRHKTATQIVMIAALVTVAVVLFAFGMMTGYFTKVNNNATAVNFTMAMSSQGDGSKAENYSFKVSLDDDDVKQVLELCNEDEEKVMSVTISVSGSGNLPLTYFVGESEDKAEAIKDRNTFEVAKSSKKVFYIFAVWERDENGNKLLDTDITYKVENVTVKVECSSYKLNTYKT
jgi:ABC-type lipoprotein release transport system permease subunit